MHRVTKAKKGSFVVVVRCTVTKQLICEDCTQEQAEEDPYAHCTDEVEIELIDWDVVNVQTNN